MDRQQVLKLRSDTLRKTREFFFNRDFIEVQTPVLSRDSMVDATIDPIPVQIDCIQTPLYLQTSPEFSMKRLLIEGCERIFEITPAFRDSEIGDLHNPEFMMLEWYRVGDNYEQGIELLRQFGEVMLPGRRYQNLTYKEAFESSVGLNPHTASFDQLVKECHEREIEYPEGTTEKDGLLEILMTELVEPALDKKALTLIRDWPATQSALARLRPLEQGYSVAERFELYAEGMELANGYHELTDPDEQRRRLELTFSKRKENGLLEIPVESRLLDEMTQSQMPSCCGVAVGFDRLLMAILGKQSVTDVMAFDIRSA